jgi:hypothetical protein
LTGSLRIGPTSRASTGDAIHEPTDRRDALISAILLLGLAVLYGVTRSRWLDDWDSVNFAFALQDFDLPKHWPHPPGYPVYVAAGKVLHLAVGDPAATLTLVSALAGASAAAMFYLLSRRYLERFEALAATLTMALAPLFWLQAGLALTDMFGLTFVVAFMLAEGVSPATERGKTIRLLFCGAIAGLSLGARPHFSLLILVYWWLRASGGGRAEARPVLTTALAFLLGVAIWLVPAAFATGGFETYFTMCLRQFEWRINKPTASVLVWPINPEHLATRAIALLGEIGQAFAPRHITNENLAGRTVVSLAVILPYAYFAWRGPARTIARPYMLAAAIYLAMLFLLLPVQHQRYLLPLALILGWAAAGVLSFFRRPTRKVIAASALVALSAVPSLFLVGGLSTTPPPVKAMQWLEGAHPNGVVYSNSLLRHAAYYWPKGDVRPQPGTNRPEDLACSAFRDALASGRPVLAAAPETCGLKGERVASFKRNRRIHNKHSRIELFRFSNRP